MAKLNVIGFDPSLKNWGIACGVLDTDTLDFNLTHVECISPLTMEGKNIRNNSKDLYRSEQLAKRAFEVVEGAQVIFAEVPIGSQSARAMASYGVCIGILSALRANQVPFLEVTPSEVKIAAVGRKTATKKQMIDWATTKYPYANWPTYTRNGETKVTESSAEHMADAVAAIHAGLASPEFQRMLPLLKAA